MASSSVYPPDHGRIIPDNRFPLMGFPNESNVPANEIVYQCWFGGHARIAIWKHRRSAGYGLNLYHAQHMTDKVRTHAADRYSYKQQPLMVADAFEAQLTINYLIQKYLPQEVIDAVCQAEADRGTTSEVSEVYPAMAQEQS